MERIEIPGRVTYSPVALQDLLLTAPFASRLLLGAFGPGQLVSAGALAFYVGSSAQDWWARRQVRYVDFEREYGSDVQSLVPMPEAARFAEVQLLAQALNDGFIAERPPRDELARRVSRRLTAYHATLTGQEVVISGEVRGFTLAKLVVPFALGACDPVSGDIAIFRDTGILEPHVLAHELCHRMGYFKELHAQVLAYLALRTSGDPVLVQAARAERLHRQLTVLCGAHTRPRQARRRYVELVDRLALRPELHRLFHALRPEPGRYEALITGAMRAAYDQRMRLMGQNGLSDYDEGFTNVLWELSRSEAARQPREHAEI